MVCRCVSPETRVKRHIPSLLHVTLFKWRICTQIQCMLGYLLVSSHADSFVMWWGFEISAYKTWAATPIQSRWMAVCLRNSTVNLVLLIKARIATLHHTKKLKWIELIEMKRIRQSVKVDVDQRRCWTISRCCQALVGPGPENLLCAMKTWKDTYERDKKHDNAGNCRQHCKMQEQLWTKTEQTVTVSPGGWRPESETGAMNQTDTRPWGKEGKRKRERRSQDGRWFSAS